MVGGELEERVPLEAKWRKPSQRKGHDQLFKELWIDQVGWDQGFTIGLEMGSFVILLYCFQGDESVIGVDLERIGEE